MSSSNAWSKISLKFSKDKGFKVKTFDLDKSGEITSKEGFSVVAPINIIVPFSTACKSASC